MIRFPAVAAPLLLAACVEEGGSSGLLLPDQVQVGWEAEYNGHGDGLGALVPVDVMAYDGVTGEPTPGVLLHVWTDDVAAFPVPVDGVTVLDADVLAAEVVGPVPRARELLVRPTPSVQFVHPTPSVRELLEVWDAEHDEFVAIDPADQLDLRTDSGGVARLYLFVDAFPETPEGFAAVRVVVTLGESAAAEGKGTDARDADGLFWLAPR